MKDLKYEHQSIKVGGWWGGWRVHGKGGCGGVGAWWGGWLEGSWGGCIYSPTHEQLQCQNISFYEHPPTNQTYPKCHSITIHVLWMVHGVSGGWWWDGWRVHRVGEWVVEWIVGEFMGLVVVGWVVGGFIGWVNGWWGGSLESSWGGCVCGGGVHGLRVNGVGAYTDPPIVTMLKYLIL